MFAITAVSNLAQRPRGFGGGTTGLFAYLAESPLPSTELMACFRPFQYGTVRPAQRLAQLFAVATIIRAAETTQPVPGSLAPHRYRSCGMYTQLPNSIYRTGPSCRTVLRHGSTVGAVCVVARRSGVAVSRPSVAVLAAIAACESIRTVPGPLILLQPPSL